MSKYYVQVRQVIAVPKEKDGKPGYDVTTRNGDKLWQPKDSFEDETIDFSANETHVTQPIVQDMVAKVKSESVSEKSVLTTATLVSGYEILETSSCVDASKINVRVAKEKAMQHVYRRVWQHMGFLLQLAVSGTKAVDVKHRHTKKARTKT